VKTGRKNESPRVIFTRGDFGLHRNGVSRGRTGRGGFGESYGGGGITFRAADDNMWTTCAYSQLTKARRVAARGWDFGSSIGGGGCHSERRSKSSGFRQKLRWPKTAVDCGQ